MSNPWEKLYKELSDGSPCSIPKQACFNSIKVEGLLSVKPDFFPDERLVACKTCGVILIQDKIRFHCDELHNSLTADVSVHNWLPYNAISMCQKLAETVRLREKVAVKQHKSGSSRKSKSYGATHLNQDGVLKSRIKDRKTHSRKNSSAKLHVFGETQNAVIAPERDKISSSSSCDRFSFGDFNSPCSPGTESTSSAPPKLADGNGDSHSKMSRRGLMEILLEESANLSSKGHRGTLLSSSVKGASCNFVPVSFSQVCSSSFSTANSSTSGLFHMSSQQLAERKQIDCSRFSNGSIEDSMHILRNPRSSKKSASIILYNQKVAEPDLNFPQSRYLHSPKIPRISCDPTINTKSNEDELYQGEVELVDSSSDFCSARDEIADAVYHLKHDSCSNVNNQYGCVKGNLAEVETFLGGSSAKQTWEDAAPFLIDESWSNLHAPRDFSKIYETIDLEQVNSPPFENIANSGYELTSQFALKENSGGFHRHSASKFQQTIKTEHSNSFYQSLFGTQVTTSRGAFSDQVRTSDGVNPLTHCCCVEMDDLSCKNSILCTVHTVQEKRRVSRPRDLKVLMREARQYRSATKMRRISALQQQQQQPFSSAPTTSWSRALTAERPTPARPQMQQQNRLSGVSLSTTPSTLDFVYNQGVIATTTTTTAAAAAIDLRKLSNTSDLPDQTCISSHSDKSLSLKLRRCSQTGSGHMPSASILRSSTQLAPPSSLAASGGSHKRFLSREGLVFSDNSDNPQTNTAGGQTVLHRKVFHPSSLFRRGRLWLGSHDGGSNSNGATPGLNLSSNSNMLENFHMSRLSSAPSTSSPLSSLPTGCSSRVFFSSSSLPTTTALTHGVTSACLPGLYSQTFDSKVLPRSGAGDLGEFQGRVVVSDVREKSITGRSRKSSRNCFRQAANSSHNAFMVAAANQLQPFSSASTTTRQPTAVILRTGTTAAGSERLLPVAAALKPASASRNHQQPPFLVNTSSISSGSSSRQHSIPQRSGKPLQAAMGLTKSVYVQQATVAVDADGAPVVTLPTASHQNHNHHSNAPAAAMTVSTNSAPNRYILIGAKSLKKQQATAHGRIAYSSDSTSTGECLTSLVNKISPIVDHLSAETLSNSNIASGGWGYRSNESTRGPTILPGTAGDHPTAVATGDSLAVAAAASTSAASASQQQMFLVRARRQ